MSRLPLLSRDKESTSYDTRKGRNPSPYLNGGQFHVNLPALTNTWPHKRHFIAQDSVASTLHNEARRKHRQQPLGIGEL